jgi:hypothetical protein
LKGRGFSRAAMGDKNISFSRPIFDPAIDAACTTVEERRFSAA